VSVPLRAAPLLAATLNVTVPLPVPLVRPVRLIHDALLLADQSHDAGAPTEMELLVAPDARNDTSLGETATLQVMGVTGGGGAALACWVSFTVWSATTIEAARVVVAAFAATVKLTLPVPVPVVPAVSTTHPASACALHAQPLAAVTVILPLPPAAGMICSVTESSKRQGAAS
jgi:hypothetical protein